MDLNSRWDRGAVLSLLLLSVASMPGCGALFGSGSSNSAVVVGMANMNFGTVVVGSSKQLSNTVMNRSGAPVTIASAAVSDSSFRVTSPTMPFMLAPGQSAPLTISFTPQATGTPTGKIAIKSTMASAREIDVAVSGTAVTAGKLDASPASLAFGNVHVGQSSAKTATITNSGSTGVTISQDSANNSAFAISGLSLPATLTPGQTAMLTVTFAPKTPGTVSGNVTVSGNASLSVGAASGSSGSQTASTSVSLSVSGDASTAGQLAATPAGLAFGSVTVGSTQSQTVNLTNSGGTSATISQATITGSGLSISGIALPLTLAAGQSSTFGVTFTPASAGAVAGGISIVSTAANSTLSMAVTANGVMPGALTTNPASVAFGNVSVGSTQNQPATITNPGGSPVTITRTTVTGASFSVSGLNLPQTLTPGQSSGFMVTFAPQAAGNVTGDIAFTSDIATLNLPLSGSGQAAGGLSASPSSVSFGSIQVGSNQAQTITLTNGSVSAIQISQATASGTGFSITGISPQLTIAAGQSTTFTATFSPVAAGAVTGNLAIASTATNPTLNIPLSGTGVTPATMAVNPASISFGSVQVGSTQSRSATLSNSGGSPLHISGATVAGTGFNINGISVPMTLNAGQSLTFNVTFTPAASGSSSGTLALAADGTVPTVSVPLSGSGTSPGQLTLTPATANFGSVTVGVTQNQAAKLTVSGNEVTVSSAASSNPEFSLTGLSLPMTLAAGQSATFNLTFTPQSSGSASGTVSFTANDTNGPVAVSLSGTGNPLPQHTVSLGWTTSTSTVVGYNVYRGTQSGGPYAVLTSSPDPSTSYTDNSVQAGQTYYYVITAVDGSGNESVDSNQAQAVIPTP
jgi:hypothetical protein